mgnify:CR=1 FL=1
MEILWKRSYNSGRLRSDHRRSYNGQEALSRMADSEDGLIFPSYWTKDAPTLRHECCLEGNNNVHFSVGSNLRTEIRLQRGLPTDFDHSYECNAFDEDVKRSLASGMNGHLSKPVTVEKLIEMLESSFRKAACDQDAP